MSKYRQDQVIVFPKGLKKIIPVIVIVLIMGGIIASSVAIVPAGYRGVLLNWGAVNTDKVLDK